MSAAAAGRIAAKSAITPAEKSFLIAYIPNATDRVALLRPQQ
jgi:hypothetical protein